MLFYSPVNSVQSDANYSKCSRGMHFLCASSSLCVCLTLRKVVQQQTLGQVVVLIPASFVYLFWNYR